MTKHDELTKPDSCLSKARDNEMLFVLLGRDAAAPAVVRAWILERIRLGKNQPGDPQLVEALEWARIVEGEQAFEAGGQEWADWNMANNPFGDEP